MCRVVTFIFTLRISIATIMNIVKDYTSTGVGNEMGPKNCMAGIQSKFDQVVGRVGTMGNPKI